MNANDLEVGQKFLCICKMPCYNRFLKGGKYRGVIADGDKVFVYLPKKKHYGYYFDNNSFDQLFSIVPAKDETEEWHKRIRRAMKIIESSGLWTDKIEYLENLLTMSMADKKELQDIQEEYYSQRCNYNLDRINSFAEKFPFAIGNDADGNPYVKLDYISDMSSVTLKSAYFGKLNKWYKDQIRQALEDKRSYRTGIIQVSYDNSFSYDAELGKAWYSEEYRGCGNGHYYLALNENVAWFCEDD